jgi:hypothetical protein
MSIFWVTIHGRRRAIHTPAGGEQECLRLSVHTITSRAADTLLATLDILCLLIERTFVTS